MRRTNIARGEKNIVKVNSRQGHQLEGTKIIANHGANAFV